uniref:Peptidase M14 domain-containing protein n=1 Tax=Amphiprion ocellaris TaxID=80972 RepID=A0AAQ5ZY36_AMPOC
MLALFLNTKKKSQDGTVHQLTKKAKNDAHSNDLSFLSIFHCPFISLTEANVWSIVSKGYISGLLKLYEDWHSKDTHHVAIAIRHALLCCLHNATQTTGGRQALISQGGIQLLYQTTQTCLLSKSLECLVESTVQLMRKCLPKTPLPLTSDKSAYTFPLPGRPHAVPDVDVTPDESSVGSDAEEDEDNQEANSTDYDDDLETDLNKLCLRPDLDRPKELLQQYSHLCPELSHDFQVHVCLCVFYGVIQLSVSASVCQCHSIQFNSGKAEIKRESNKGERERKERGGHGRSGEGRCRDWGGGCDRGTDIRLTGFPKSLTALSLKLDIYLISGSCSVNILFPASSGETPPGQRREEQDGDEEGAEEGYHRTTIDRLLERHGACIPHHVPKLYRAAAAKTKSIPGFGILAFPDFWGHLPPPGHEPMAPRKPNTQRQKVFEDVQRFLNTDDIINLLVFDLENSRYVTTDTDTTQQFYKSLLHFLIKFLCSNDVNCSQHTQWFYFEVSNMVAGIPYRFNVINCEKSNSQFNYGMQPVLYSVREALDGRPRWVRTGTEICYYRNYFCPAQGRRKTTFYTLSFTITFKHNEDVCYLAYHYPYTYSALKAHLKVLQKSVDPAKVFFQQQILCGTLAGNSCPLVTITACPASKGWKDLHQLRNRPCIVLTSRVHPGESNASWVMKGTLEFLCSSDLVAQSLREAFVFKIIPMLNPDGVINGTNRCDVNSEDLNRQWCKPDPVLSPTIYHTKGFLYYLNSIGRTPLVFCDYHGHSRKKNVFLYGCSIKETLWQSGSAIDTVGLKEDPGYRTIPKTLDRIAPAFSFNSCNYLVEKSRSATARVVVWREMGVLRSYTMESTYNGCDQGIYKGLQIGTRELQEMGVKFCHSLLSVTKDTKLLYSRRLINHIDLDHNILDHNEESLHHL